METLHDTYNMPKFKGDRPLLTIVMAVYNSQRFLAAAIDSILKQSMSDFELILINDGSSDNSSVICKEYKQRDNRVVYIEKENEGVAIARNCALDIAKGKYVMFVDSDDILYTGTLTAIRSALEENNSDILRFEFNTIDEDGNKLYPNYEGKRRKIYNNQIFTPSDYILKILRNEFYLCMNVFRRKILDKHKLRFAEGCSYMEDCDFIIRFLAVSSICGYSSFVGYGYRKYSTSATAKLTEKKYKDILFAFNNVVRYSNDTKNIKLKKAIKYAAEGIGLSAYKNTFIFNDISNRKNIIKYCVKKPIRLEWRLFQFSNTRLWQTISYLRKIRNHLLLM